ncbi:MAG: class cytochrome family protein, partial [Hyphomicrobiales bacterium]|nr:class cytochrome family protein [Hyphomicrobiales bacterium]
MFGYSLRLVVLLLGVALGLVFKLAAGMSPGASAQGLGQEPPSYVGSGACAGCHAQQFADWTTSDHAHAMSPATAETVLGDFAGPRIEHLGATAQFRRDEGKFIVETEGRDGKIAPFVVSHTFAWKPLQQYLVTFPDGRLQTLPWAWDTRPRDQGGQR